MFPKKCVYTGKSSSAVAGEVEKRTYVRHLFALGSPLLPTSWLALSQQGGGVPTIPTRTGEDGSTIPISLRMSPEVLPLTSILLTFRGVL